MSRRRSSPVGSLACLSWALLLNASVGMGEEAAIVLRQPASPTLLTVGTTLQLECVIEGQPTAVVQWYHNKLLIASDSDVVSAADHRMLTIRNLSTGNNGVYSCSGTNDAGVVHSQRDFLLNVVGATGPRLVSFGQDVSSRVLKTLVKRNDTIVLPCQFDGSTPVTWKKKEAKGTSGAFRPLPTTPARAIVGNDGTLRIATARPSDEGSYMCSAVADGVTNTFVTDVVLMRVDPLYRNTSILPPPMSGQPAGLVLVKEGASVDLRCLKASGIPQPTLRWEDPSGNVITSADQRVYTEGVHALIRSASRTAHSGNYTCLAKNAAGEQRVTVAVVVTYPPTIRRPPADVTVAEGKSFSLDCEYSGLRFPVTRVTWLKDGAPLVSPSSFASMNEETGVLTLLDASPSSIDGQYSCRVTTGDELPVTSVAATVRVAQRLRFVPSPVNKVLELGGTERVPCVARGHEPPRVTWQRVSPEAAMPLNSRTDDGTLIFDEVSRSDAGHYMCTASLGAEFINVTIRIEVGMRPQFSEAPTNSTAYVGRTASLHCGVTGDPAPTTQWSRGEASNFFDSSDSLAGPLARIVTFPNGTLHFREVQPDDQGKYTCLAGSSLGGFISASVHVSVKNCTGTECDHLAAADTLSKDEGLGMVQTIVIAVCSAAAYLALVVGLTVWCSIRLMRKKKLEKLRNGEASTKVDVEGRPTGHPVARATSNDYARDPLETDRLMSCAAGGAGQSPSKQNGSHHPQAVVIAAAVTPSHVPIEGVAGQRSYPREKLQMVGMLGKGEYGDVYLARAPGLAVPAAGRQAWPEAPAAAGAQSVPLVYVKSLLAADDAAVRAQFMRELDTFGRLRHERVCALLGTCPGTSTEPALMLMEYCEWGDLKQFLMATRKDSGQQLTIAPPSLAHKLSLCGQVAAAMEHMAGRGLAHGDLAARNVLLQNDLAGVKVGNLGLTRTVYASEYYRPAAGSGGAAAALPLRWMAPDALLERLSGGRQPSEADDVWSYGVVLWEVLTGAELPHAERTDDELVALFEACCSGGSSESGAQAAAAARPELRSDFDAGAARLMSRCWAQRASDRPTFADVVAAFADLCVDTGV